MPISRKARIWIIILCTPVILLAGAAVALKLYFTSDRLKSLIIPNLEQATNRTVNLQSISLSVFPSLAVEIEGLTISNRKEQGFSEKPFLALERLVLDVRLAPLLKGVVEVPTVRLERPTVLLEINKDGIRNYRMQTPPEVRADTAKPVTPTGGAAAGFLLSNLQILNGRVDYIDWQENSATTADSLNVQMRVETDPGTNQGKIEGKATVGQFSYGTATSASPLIANLHLALDYALAYEQNKDLLTVRRGDGTLQDIPLKISGTVTHLMQIPELNLVVSSDQVSIPQLFSLAPKEYMKKAEGLEASGSGQIRIVITGRVTDTTKADLAGTITTTNATMRYTRLPKPITNINVAADFARTKTTQEFRLTKFSALLGSNPIAATLTVINFEDPALTLAVDGSMNLAEVKEYYPLEAGTDLAGSLNAKVNISGKISTPSALKATGTMVFQNVTMNSPGSKNPIRNLNGAITFNNQIVEAKKLSMSLGTSDLSLAFWLKNYLSLIAKAKNAPKPTANITLTSNHLSTADITSQAPDHSMGGTQQQSQPPGKGATGSPQPSGVPLPDVDMDVAATVGNLAMEKFDLNNVRTTMKISNGIVALQNFSCNAFDGSINTKGTLNLQKQDRPVVDLTMDANGVNANSLLSQFTSFGKLLRGKLTMNTSIKGALDDTLGLVRQTLAGQGRVLMENGQVNGLKVNSTLAGLLNLPDLETINFKDWANTFSISDGRINIKDLKIAALGADYLINGSQGLDGSMDYRLSLVLSENSSARVSVPGFAGEAVNFLKDERGRLKLDFTVGGNTDKPAVALDTRAAQQRVEEATRQKLGDQTKKAQEQLKQKGQDLLKDLFKKKK